MERFGEVERSRENRTDRAEGEVPRMLTRVGEAERVNKVVVPDEKLELEEEAKYGEEEYRDGE